ncbi:hypothetical protein RHMOL_Rhmol02G0154700 [Rhododendron molle]|uniref:Uncharacterized protein n=1 Tax=Rhododendron molle TaxID=49168 RepID=A0ACC0PQT3_RHOML|nr:hypothetical protein RHMOL_Rhmol02G0154700 [Rhododendron molle]
MSTQSGAFLKPIRTTPPVAAAPAAYRHIRSDVGRTRSVVLVSKVRVRSGFWRVGFSTLVVNAAISNAYATTYGLYSNPQFKNAGKFMALRDFLALAYNTSSVSGVLIIIEVS